MFDCSSCHKSTNKEKDLKHNFCGGFIMWTSDASDRACNRQTDMRFIICFIQASKGQGKIDNNSPNIQKKKLIKWQKGMLSIFFPQNSPLKPLKTEHFLFELFPFFSLPSFIQQTRPDVSVHCRPGWRLVFIVIFLIYYLFSFYFVLCVFQLLSIGEAGLKVPHSCGKKKKKKKSYVTFSIYKRL